MRKIFFIIVVFLLASYNMAGQETSREKFEERYNSLVSAVGVAGVGVETLLNKWETAYPEDSKVHQGRFLLLFTKAGTESVKRVDKSKYLGQDPVLSLKDSLGRPVNYFREINYDDVMFGAAIKAVDKAIQLSPEDLGLRMAKISALTSYEKESPEMAASELKALIDYTFTQKPKWLYQGQEVTTEIFEATIQEYCFTFFKYATPASYEAFGALSKKMLSYSPSNVLFLNNVGSYYLVAKKDSKTALKYYNRALKKKPDDLTAITNCILLARNEKNLKLEKKYLPKLIQYSPDEKTREASKIRLESLK